MIKYLKTILLISTGSLLIMNFTACNTAKKAVPEEVIKAPERKLTVEDYLKHIVDFESFSGKADLSIIKGTDQQNLSTNLRMRKGKDIWSSIIALGIAEVARAYVTPDSLQAIIRIGKKAYSLPYQEGLKLIDADFEFPVLQNLLIGNPLIQDSKVVKMEEKENHVLITVHQDDFIQILTYDKTTSLLQHLSLISEKRGFTCNIEYSEYKALALNQYFAHSKMIRIQNGIEQIQVKMDFSKAAINIPVEMDFSIPSSYTLEKVNK